MNETLLYKQIGLILKKHRRKLGLTQEQLANQIGISRASIANMEIGRQKILIDHLYRLADKLDTKITNLLPETDEIFGGSEFEDLQFSEDLNLEQQKQIARLLNENNLTLTSRGKRAQSKHKSKG